MRKMRSLLIALSVFIVFISSTSATVAGTPDGMTPANEGICDDLMYATKGLYGLCIAYCEAQDAIEDLTDSDALANLPTPHKKILENYDKKRTESDPTMPCVVYTNPCPVWTPEELATIGYTTDGSILQVNDWYRSSNSYEQLIDQEIGYDSLGNRINIGASVYTTNGVDFTGIFLRYDSSDFEGRIYRRLQLTADEYSACKQQIYDHIVPIY
jgi:hypothetical protein